jgi:hypothetical protein
MQIEINEEHLEKADDPIRESFESLCKSIIDRLQQPEKAFSP